MALARCWIDGELVAVTAATVPLVSSAVFRGSSVFEVLAVVDHGNGPAVIGLDLHLERFMASMRLMRMRSTVSVADLRRAATAVVADQQPGTVGILRMVAYWSGAVSGAPSDRRPQIAVIAEPPALPPPPHLRLASATAKIAATALPPELKVAASYAPSLIAELDAVDADFDGVVNFDCDGYLLEAMSSSVGIIDRETIRFPGLDQVLHSITRQLVIDVATNRGLEVLVGPIARDAVTTAEAVFVCSTTKPLVPVTAIDDQIYPADHSVTTALAGTVHDVIAGSHELAAAWLNPL